MTERSVTMETTYLSPLLARNGAVEADGPDLGVAWHYGDPVAEQRALVENRAVVDQSHLGVISVTGPDRTSWLTTLGTQVISDTPVGESQEWMILSPQGRIEYVANVVDDGTTTWLVTEQPEGLRAHLEKMRFMLRVEITDVSSEWAVLGEPLSTPGATHEPVTWVDPWPHIQSGGTTYHRRPEHPGVKREWRLVLVPRSDLMAAIASRLDAGWMLAGTWAAEALRIEALRPRFSREVDATALPHEYDWLRTAVHLDKGCYRGQETVAKVHNVGRPPRRLTLLHLDGSSHAIPSAGASIRLASNPDSVIGYVTSVSRHHELGPIALGLVKRSTPEDAALIIGADSEEVSATQEAIVNRDGESVDRPPAVGPTQKGLLMGKGCDAPGGDLS